MALISDVTKVKNFKKLCYNKDDSMNPVTHALIFGSMATGIGEITEKTVEKVAERFAALELSGVTYLLNKDEDSCRNPTLDEVRAHIGLETNVSRVTDAMFKRQLGESLFSQAKDLVKAQLESASKVDLKVAK